MQVSENSDVTARPLDEEHINALTHGIGFLLSCLVLILICRHAADLPRMTLICCLIYAGSLMLVYGASTASHAVQEPARKQTLRILDQSVIYFLIAGTYTPLVWHFCTPTTATISLVLIWLAALSGAFTKLVWQRKVSDDFSTRSYLCLGWFPAMILIWNAPVPCMLGLLAGGVSYTAGTYFLMNDGRRLHHAIWHLLVMLGSAIHFYTIYTSVIVG